MNKHTLKLFGILILVVFIFNSCFKDDLLKEIDALKTQVSDMKKRNDSLNNVLNVRADSLAKALTSAQKRSDSLSNVLRTKSDSLSQALGLTNANLANLTKAVDSIKTKIATISGQLTQLNVQLTSITTQLTQLNQQLGALGGDVSQLAAQYQALSASLQTINTQIAALQAEQLKLLEKLNAILLQLNPPVDLTTGLVAYYPFSGNAGDSSGNGNHGVVNGATLTSDRFGKNNNAMSFNGINNYMTIPSSVSLNMGANITFSISLFFKSGPKTSSSFEGLIGKMYPTGGNLGANNGWQLGRSNNLIRFQSRSGISSNTFFNQPCGSDNVGNIFLDKNDHYTFIFERSIGVLKFFLNGTLISSANCSDLNGDFSNNYPLLIGTEREKSFFINGVIDDIRIYNRALTQSEITYLATH